MKKDTIYETAMLFCFLAMPLGMLLLALTACDPTPQPKPKHIRCYKRDKPQCWTEADWEVVCERIHCK